MRQKPNPIQVVVVDITTATTEEAARLMNGLCEQGYYIHRAMEHNGGAKVIFVAQYKPWRGPVRDKRGYSYAIPTGQPRDEYFAARGSVKAIGFPRKRGLDN